jgi:hypothetical protein
MDGFSRMDDFGKEIKEMENITKKGEGNTHTTFTFHSRGKYHPLLLLLPYSNNQLRLRYNYSTAVSN